MDLVGDQIERQEQKIIIIINCWLCSLQEVVIEGPEVDIVEKIKKARGKGKEVVRVVEKMKKAGIKVLQGNEWQLKGDLVSKEGKIYIPKDEELRVEIIWLHHDVLAAEHGGRWKMMELVTRNYWQPGITKDIGKYIEGYDMCQRMKNRTEILAEKLMTNEILEKMWTHLMVNFITKLLLVAGKDAILVVCDRLLKIAYFVATMEETTAEGLVRLFKDNV